MAKAEFKEQAFFFDPREWTVRKAWTWLKNKGFKREKAKRENIRFKGRGEWFGWAIRTVPKGRAGRLRWIPFGKSIMVRFIAPGKRAPRKTTAKNSPATELQRASRRRAEFLDDGSKAQDLPVETMTVATLRIPKRGLILIGNHRQLNYSAKKFGKGWIEYHHRPDGFPKVGQGLTSTRAGRSFLHPDGAFIIIFPGPEQGGKFTMDERGLLN